MIDTTPVMLTPYTGEYFNIWKFQVQCIFRSRKLLDIVEGTEMFDPNADPAVQQYWRQRDQQAMDILVQTMDRKFLPPMLGIRSSRQMWTQLLLHYDKRVTQTVHGLQKRFFDLKPTPGKGIRSFLSDINDVNDQLRELDVSKAFEEDALISKVLSSLPADFFYFNSAWDSTSESDKILLNLSERLVKEEDKLKHAAQNPIDVTKAFYSRLPPRPSPSQSASHLCHGHKCSHPSHLSLPQQSTSRFPPPVSNPDGSPLNPEQRQLRQKYFDDLKKTTLCNHCGHTGHWKGECPRLTEDERQVLRQRLPRPVLQSPPTQALSATSISVPDNPVAFMATLSLDTSSEVNADQWYVDSAASRHMTGRREWFTTFTELPAQR
jgi:hypothetical protein